MSFSSKIYLSQSSTSFKHAFLLLSTMKRDSSTQITLLQSLQCSLPTIYAEDIQPRHCSTAKRPRLHTTSGLHVSQNDTTAETAAPPKDAAPTLGSSSPPQEPKQLVPTSSFYSKTSRRLLDVECSVLKFLRRAKHRAAGYTCPELWRQFPTQRQAFEFADAKDPSGERLKVFSVELPSTGTRRFVTCSYPEFYRRYASMTPKHRHYYEIIRDGWPCHLYFDLEYDRTINPDADGAAAVEALVSLVRDALGHKILGEEDSSSKQTDLDLSIVELDSSTAIKFSRHLIVRLPGAVFATNAHVGAFVLDLCNEIWLRRDKDPRCSSLIVSKQTAEGVAEGSRTEASSGRRTATSATSPETLVIDTGVYTRNRAFRLHLSSKAGKDAVLRPTGRFGCQGWAQEQIFMASLVCNIDPSLPLVRCFSEDAAAHGPTTLPGGHMHHESGSRNSCAKASDILCQSSGAYKGSRVHHRGASLRRSISSTGATCEPTPYLRYGPSRFPALERFIIAVCSSYAGHGRAFVRSWVMLDEGKVMLFNIGGNRWCGNIDREHRSNGVFYVVDLQQGVWYQKCYDPECRSYRSPANSLPQELMTMNFSFVSSSSSSSALEKNATEASSIHGAVGGIDSVAENDWADDDWEIVAMKVVELLNPSSTIRNGKVDIDDTSSDRSG